MGKAWTAELLAAPGFLHAQRLPVAIGEGEEIRSRIGRPSACAASGAATTTSSKLGGHARWRLRLAEVNQTFPSA